MDRLKRKRGTLRASTTKIINEMKSMLDVNPLPIGELNEHLNMLKQKKSVLTNLDKEIEQHVPDEELDEEFATAEHYQDSIDRMIYRSERQLMATCPSAISTRQEVAPSRERVQVRLPKLEIQPFDGELIRWPEFWDQFESTIHKNPSLDNVDKFKYLRSYLKGKAEGMISGLSTTNESYPTAIELLQQRYGDKTLIINEHMSKLLNLPRVASCDDLNGLQALHEQIHTHVRSLKNLGVDVAAYGVMLKTSLLQTLPRELVLKFNQLTLKETSTRGTGGERTDEVSVLLDLLHLEVRSRETTFVMTGPPVDTPIKNQSVRRQVKEHFQGSASMLTVRSSRSGCVFCESNEHITEDCTAQLTLDEKKARLQQQGCCFRCARPLHRAKECKVARRLSCRNCQGRHITPLCDPNWKRRSLEKPTTVSSSATESVTPQRTVLLQTAQVWAKGTATKHLVRLLLDGGSQRSFITETLSKKLRPKVLAEEQMTISGFGNSSFHRKRYKRVQLTLYSQYDNHGFEIDAIEVPEICNDLSRLTEQTILQELDASAMPFADVTCFETQTEPGISLLIGADFYWKLVTGDIQRLNENLTAVKTVFGWTVHGDATVTSPIIGSQEVNSFHVATEECISEQMKAFWELEHLGLSDKSELSEEDHEVLKSFAETTFKRSGRYHVELPWRPNRHELRDNRDVACRRLETLQRKLKREPEFQNEYDMTIRSYFHNDFAEKVTSDSIQGPVYYMPHRAVVKRERETTKVRIVFDASSHAPGCPSLNDVLWVGPNLNPSILHLLLKFRSYRTGISADIEKAFLQVSLVKKDRDAFRFLWYKENSSNIEEYRMTRVPFGASSSPFLLAATLRHHFRQVENQYPTIAPRLKDHFYVDDLVIGARSFEEARTLVNDCFHILQDAGMRLTKWTTNSRHLRESYSESDPLKFDAGAEKKILGLVWNTREDTLKSPLQHMLNQHKEPKRTKREILSFASQIYDPFGLLAPFVLPTKLLIQKLWMQKYSWDEPLPECLLKDWIVWTEGLNDIAKFSFPRYFGCSLDDKRVNTAIHAFSDASPAAYGAVLYLKTQEGTRPPTIQVLLAKSRVAPLRKLTLPRLELMGALVAARLAKSLKQALDIEDIDTVMWTDSTIALHWIKNSTKKWKPFVANRVAEIQSLTDVNAWKHCPGEQNPADLLSRGITAQQLLQSSLWWNGPHFLSSAATEINDIEDFEHYEDIDSTGEESTLLSTNVSVLCAVPDIRSYSSYNRLVRVTAWMKRFIDNCKNPMSKRTGHLQTSETQAAELYWIRRTQQDAFGSTVTGMTSSLKRFDPYFDEERILRVGGRLQFSSLRENSKHPVLLPPTGPFTRLLVIKEHRRLLHAGVSLVLAELREVFWIIRARQVVKKVIHECTVCRRYSAKPYCEPFAPLPANRTVPSPPFEVTGLDFAGPLLHKRNGMMEKCYILIFTCAVVRAVHLELVTNLSAQQFLLAFRRFVARRGLCRIIYSDNGRTFKRASKDITRLWTLMKGDEIQGYFSANSIHWKFIVEQAPWWGGFWERLIRTIKTTLKKIIGKNSLNFEELATILTQVEAITNSRPITYVYSEPYEPNPLTPGHFLIGQRLTMLPQESSCPSSAPETSSAEKLRGRWKHREQLLERLWNRWRREYLHELRSAHMSSRAVPISIHLGDVVLIGERNAPRQMWMLGRVTQLFQGRDGKVRSCEVRTSAGTTLRRPIQLLYRLEASDPRTPNVEDSKSKPT